MTDSPIDVLEPLDYPWGGDGSDPLEPIRAHVLAALIPTDQPYPAPLDQLLTLGSALEPEPDQAFDEIRFLPEHAADLVRMARDRALHTAKSDSTQVWAPIWAARALGRIDARDRAADLVPLLDLDDDGNAGFLAEVFMTFGEAALPPLSIYVQDHNRWMYSRTQAIEIINDVVDAHPELRDQVVKMYTSALADATSDQATFNGFLLAGLLQQKAVESLPVIRQAFEQDAIDLDIAGDWLDVLEELGLPIDESDPLIQAAYQQNQINAQRLRSGSAMGNPSPSTIKKNKAIKKKQKRKTSAASRKTNKKRR